MQGDFLNSEKWLALVFEGRNKEYGAYVQREESSDRHLKAMLLITVIALGLIFLPKALQSVLPVRDDGVVQTIPVNPTIIVTQEDVNKTPINKVVLQPPSLKSSIGFTIPKVTDDNKVRNEDLMQTQQALSDSKVDISVETIEGKPGGTVDIADAKVNNDIVGDGGIGETKKSEIPVHVEVMPVFPGGQAALMKWLQDNLIYPVDAQERNIQGRVSLRFVVKSDGSVDGVEVLKGFDPSCDKEAVRVVKKMPKWIPGKQNGNAVSVYYSLPIVFRLNK